MRPSRALACGVAWHGVVRCTAVWCGLVCRRHCYQMAMAGMVLHTGNAKLEGYVFECTLCVVCCALVKGQESLCTRSRFLAQGVVSLHSGFSLGLP